MYTDKIIQQYHPYCKINLEIYSLNKGRTFYNACDMRYSVFTVTIKKKNIIVVVCTSSTNSVNYLKIHCQFVDGTALNQSHEILLIFVLKIY